MKPIARWAAALISLSGEVSDPNSVQPCERPHVSDAATRARPASGARGTGHVMPIRYDAGAVPDPSTRRAARLLLLLSLPRPAMLSVFRSSPFTLVHTREPRAVDDEMERSLRREAEAANREALTPPKAEAARRATGAFGPTATSAATAPDPEVPAKAQRRRFTAEYRVSWLA